MWPRAIEEELEHEIECEAARRCHEKKKRRIAMTSQCEKQSGDRNDHHHDCSSSKRGDLEHQLIDGMCAMCAEKAQYCYVECLCFSGDDGFSNLAEEPGCKDCDDYADDQKDSECSKK